MSIKRNMKVGQVYQNNSDPEFTVRITDRITTPHGAHFVGQCYHREEFTRAWAAPSDRFRFKEFTLLSDAKASQLELELKLEEAEEKLPPEIQAIKELLEGHFGEGSTLFTKLNRSDVVDKLMDALTGTKTPSPSQIHWVRENREWISHISDGVFTTEEVLADAEHHARLFNSGFTCCDDPECELRKVAARFPKH